MKIRVRLILAFFVLIGVAAWSMLDSFQTELKPALRRSMEDTLVDSANLLAELAHDDFMAGNLAHGPFSTRVHAYLQRDLRANVWGVDKHRASHRIYITNTQGLVVFDSAGIALGANYARWNDVMRTLRGQYGARTTRDNTGDPTTSVMYVAAPILDHGQIVGVLTVAKPNQTVQPFFDQSERKLRNTGWVVLGGGLVLGVLISWWLTSQLEKLVQYARRVAAGERAVLPALKGSGELQVLGEALEGMRVRLEGKAYVEDYVHSLTHEMKSPLAAIRGAAELIDPQMPQQDQMRFLGHIRRETGFLQQLIDRLLDLARLERRRTLQEVAPIPLAALVAQVITDREPIWQARQLQVHQDVPADCVPTGEYFLVKQAVGNLLDNAIAFSAEGGLISINVVQEGFEGTYIHVRDHGAGIPDYAESRIFERFYSLPRPGGERKSSGLGLAFVREVAALHGGDVTVGNHAEGGVLAVLRLPVQAAP